MSSHLQWAPKVMSDGTLERLCNNGSKKTSTSSQQRTSSIEEPKPESNVEGKLTPFQLCWSFGMNKNIPVLNLTSASNQLLFYASSHAGVLYDYKAREMKLLQGHQNAVSSIAADSAGKWIVTADMGEDSAVIVWNTDLCLPVNTLFNPYPGGTRSVGISPNAKYLVTVSDDPGPNIAFWLWTYGREEPDATYALDSSFGKAVQIVFNSEISEEFMVTSHTRIAFFNWEKDALSGHVPEVGSGKIGRFNESVFLPVMNQALTCSAKGFVAVWKALSSLPEQRHEKHLYKEIRLQRDGITTIRAVDTVNMSDDDFKSVVVTGNSRGHIRFYDQYLRILYWCQKFSLDSIVSISFHIEGQKYQYGDPLDFDSDKSPRTCKKVSEQLENDEEDCSEQYEIIYKNCVPSDASLLRRPFMVKDFVVCTVKGGLGLVNFLQNHYQVIHNPSEAAITAIDVHPDKTQIVCGNKIGQLFIYNYHTKEFLLEYTLPQSSKSGGPVGIRSLKYSDSGFLLLCGMDDGTLWSVDPNILEPINSFHYAKGAITKICITKDAKYIAHMDECMCVSLYRCDETDASSWEYLGKQRSHYKPVRDIMFGEKADDASFPRLFSLGEDRVLVEYDIKNSDANDLRIHGMERVEQSAVPHCMTWYPMFTAESFILTANSERLGSLTKVECQKTYMIIASEKQIGIQTLPIDGNPFKSVGMIGHPGKIQHICPTPDGKYLFTTGQDDTCILQWQINTRAVDVMAKIGGEGIYPYYGLIDGGQTGWLFQEMQDMFYYAQILHQGENMATTRQVTDKIPLCELPDLMRGIGYYPTDYETENMLHEVMFANYAETNKQEDHIRFEDFVRLYINHHPAFGVYAGQLEAAFDTFADTFNAEGPNVLTREDFLNVLQERGEEFSKEQTLKYMSILLQRHDPKKTAQANKEREDKPTNENLDDTFIEAYNRIPEVNVMKSATQA